MATIEEEEGQGNIVFIKNRPNGPNRVPPLGLQRPGQLGPIRPPVCLPRKQETTKTTIGNSMADLEREVSINKKGITTLPSVAIKNITVSFMSAEDIIKQGVASIDKPTLSGEQSVNDPRMGATDFIQNCPTCFKDSLNCTGHFGYIKLNAPILHPLAIRNIISVLKVVCNCDGRLLVPVETLRKKGILALTGINRLKEIEALAEKEYSCSSEKGCKPNPQFDIEISEEKYEIYYRTKGKKSNKKQFEPLIPYSIENVRMILEGISPETLRIIGFEDGSTPLNYIMTVLPVIPPCDRLPTDQNGEIWQDEITMAYQDIVKLNNDILNAVNEEEKQRKIYSLIDRIASMYRGKKNSKKDEKSIRSRIQGKNALPRANLMGKRVNYSGRTVISPDASLKFGQVRIPLRIAKTITKPVIINAFNKEAMTQLLRSGRVNHVIPGKNTTLPKRQIGLNIAVTDDIMKTYIPQLGDTLHRWLQNGDYVIVNRQPTLSKNSFMGMEVVVGGDYKIEDGKIIMNDGPNTIGLHLSYTTPYNADFDGDEMNIHVPQSLLSEAEVATTMNVKTCIMSGQTNKNAMGIVYNGVISAGLMTEDSTYMSMETMYECLAQLTGKLQMPSWYNRLDKYKVPRLSGKALFSALLPEDFFYTRDQVVIKEGILLKGPITKDHIGPSANSIIQSIWHQYGTDRTVEFFTDAAFVLNHWLRLRGFSVGVKDCNPEDTGLRDEVNKEIEKAKLFAETMDATHIDDPIEQERLEKQLITEIDRVEKVGKKILNDNLTTDNALASMMKYKAKGEARNIAQMKALIGQQFLGGKRMDLGLAYFDPNDPEYSLEARGFVKNSFMSGMTPAELFFVQAAGREGLIDTAINTADTGAIHHKIIKATEDITVWSDGSVRNMFGTIFQFGYGGDGLDPSYLMKVKVHGNDMLSFIDMKTEAARLNSKYGY